MPHTAALFRQLRRLTCPPSSDAELLCRWVERRDEDAFTALTARHSRMVYGAWTLTERPRFRTVQIGGW